MPEVVAVAVLLALLRLAQAVQVVVEQVQKLLLLLAGMELQTLVVAVAVLVVAFMLPHQVGLVGLAVLESSSSRSTNKDIHAKQSLSILWHQHGNGTVAPRR
jgi:hypothetical protein